MLKACLWTLCLVLAVTPGPALAAWATDPAQGTPIAVLGGSQRQPCLTSDGAGGAFAVWLDNRDSTVSRYELFAQHLGAAGEARWTASGIPAVIMPGRELLPSPNRLALDGEGGLYIGFQVGFSTGPYSVRLQHLDAYGQPTWGDSGVAVDAGVGDVYNPCVVQDGASGAIIEWQEPSNLIRAQRIGPDGAPRWAPDGVIICSSLIPQLASMVADGHGGSIIAWQDYRLDSSGDLYAQRVDSLGAVQWAANGLVVCDEPSGQGLLQAASDGQGGMLLVWGDNRSGAALTVSAQHLDVTGNKLWGVQGVRVTSTDATQYDYNGAIVADGTGGAFVTWEDHRGADTDIFTQHLDALGTRTLADQGLAVCTALHDQSSPWSVPDGAGGVIVGWLDDRNGAASRDLYAQRIDAGGAIRWAAQGQPVCTAPGPQLSMSACADASGGALMIWRDERADAGDIYAARIAPDGSLGVLAVGPGGAGDRLSRLTVAPSPASAVAAIAFTTPRPERVALDVYDLAGRHVRQLAEGPRSRGPQSVSWDLRDANGRLVESGVYLARLRTDDDVRLARLLVVR